VRGRDDQVRTIDFSLNPIKDETGQVVLLLPEGRDITERKRAEEALRESARRLQTVVDGAPIVLYSFDRHGIFTLSEGKGIAGLRLKPGEIVGRSIAEVYGNQPEAMANLRRALAGETFTVEQTFPSGSIYEISHIAMRDGKGEYDGTIGVLVDVTDRKRTEAKLKERMEELLAWEKVTLGREGRVMELKQEVNRLLAELKKAPRYPDPEIDTSPPAPKPASPG
jgi:PAS domain S-box-containing protein